jgi:aspartyl-tRNA(Asn)/glutamyl-tRNA(Gln) amidotransferase subunit A
MTDLAFTPAAELARLIARRELSPVELVEMVLTRVERTQPTLNAFITISAEPTLAAARAAEAAVIRSDCPGPLFDVPFSVKDLVNTAGVRTTFGSVVLADNVPAADSVAVAWLKQAGAILIGKATAPEFGHKCFTEATLFGHTANAWDQSRTSGGSSGDAAVAVAAGLGPLANRPRWRRLRPHLGRMQRYGRFQTDPGSRTA